MLDEKDLAGGREVRTLMVCIALQQQILSDEKNQ
jgi:hypothetical protein